MSEFPHLIYLPPRYSFARKVAGNLVQQLLVPGGAADRTVVEHSSGRAKAWLVDHKDKRILITNSKSLCNPDGGAKLLVPSLAELPTRAEDVTSYKWIEPSPALTIDEQSERVGVVLSSWADAFHFRVEETIGGVTKPGLRTPQLGAIHAALAHWTIRDDVGTIVMPTGTGKTDTMVAILVNRRIKHLLVIVPTDALRTQLAQKFLTLGVLLKAKAIEPTALFPAVGRLKKAIKTVDEARDFLGCCNVVVATMSAIRHCPQAVREHLSKTCGGLFIDEAHHTPATTWNELREQFQAEKKPILQFTATPFRNDKKYIGGRTLYQYPLRKAQKEGYFTPIKFVSIWEYDRDEGNEKVAARAIQTLREDIQAGRDHLMMARANSIEHAQKLLSIYDNLASDLGPVVVHSRLPSTEQARVLTNLTNRTSRIIVCVDMLGEGFDLPELKVAALHDLHKSLAITLQFVGRFTRTAHGLGHATIVANGALADVSEALEDLYSTDSDWNVLLTHLSEGENTYQRKRFEFLEGFKGEPSGVPLHVIRPKVSTVVYRTKCKDWNQNLSSKFIEKKHFIVPPTLNEDAKVILYILREETRVRWGDTKSVVDVQNHLFLAHWDKDQGLLFINSSDTSGNHQDLAQELAGPSAELIRGEIAFRVLHNVKRLILTNLGLTHLLSRSTRHSNFMGADVREGLTAAKTSNRKKSNLFSLGYEQGERQSLGASQKGKIWAMKAADDIPTWVDWCHHIGAKLLDDSITTDAIVEQVILPITVTERPPLVALTAEWADYFFERSEDKVSVAIGGHEALFYEAELRIVKFKNAGPLLFEVAIPGASAEYEVVFEEQKVGYRPTGSAAMVTASNRTRALSEWFSDHPPIFTFEDSSFLEYNELYKPNDAARMFDRSRIESWDWTGWDIRTESQYSRPPDVRHRPKSVQARVLEHLKAGGIDYDIIFDDDGSGEIADIVAIKADTDDLLVHLFHCKWSGEEFAGSRVGDLYEVCGQAQKSVHWKLRVEAIFEHLARRETKRLSTYGFTRFSRGSLQELQELKRRNRSRLRPKFHVWIVQPGLCAPRVSTEQLDLLGATELFLMETHHVGITVVGSDS